MLFTVKQSKPHLSWSQVSMMLRCGEQYRRRYIEGDILPPAVAPAIGTGVHIGIKRNLELKMATGELLSETQVADVTAQAAKEALSKAELSKDERLQGKKKVLGDALDMAVALGRLHASEVAPEIDPKRVESKFVLDLQGYPYDLLGYIDIQSKPRGPGTSSVGTVHDTKTAGKSPSQAQADGSDQLTLYAMAVRYLEGELPDLAYDALVKTKVPKFKRVETKRTEPDLGVMMRRIEAVQTAIEREVFLPAQADHWCCSERFCGYATSCPYFRGKISLGYGGESGGKKRQRKSK